MKNLKPPNILFFMLALLIAPPLWGAGDAQDGESESGGFSLIDGGADSRRAPARRPQASGAAKDSASDAESGSGSSGAGASTSRASASASREPENYDERDYFDANYVRNSVFYDLPYAEIPIEDLTKYQREKIISILKRRLLAYKYAMSRIEDRLEELGDDSAASSKADSSAPSKRAHEMPVEVNGKIVDAVNGILVAKSKDSTATAFFAEIKGRYFIITNMHVMEAEGDVSFYTYNGQEIKMPKMGFFSKGKDVFILPVNSIPEGCIALPTEENVSSSLKIGDDLVICGNSMGGGTLVHSMGKVVAVGPVNIEHNCNVQHGHSGSPIYCKNSKKVVGVLSHSIHFATTNGEMTAVGNTVKAKIKMKVRFFGYRFDNIRDWTPIKTDKFIELSKEMQGFINRYKHIRLAIQDNKIS
ncbi:MAG: trypsin-like peptidase domain-containing protein, partial [Opitutales bacterium]|nr:trypsin-like peptidase domain-containing protein [Opitutales bacterium]